MFLYYITETYRAVKQSKLASVITTLSITLAVLAASLSILLVVLSDIIDRELKERVQVDIFLKDNIDSERIASLKKELETEEGVNYVEFISSDKAEEMFIKETGEEFSSILDINPLPSSFKINFNKNLASEQMLDNFIDKYESNEYVDEIIYDYSTVISVLNFVNSSRIIIFSIALLLIVFAVYLVYSTNKLQIQNKLAQLNTMKLVGATLSTIKIPLYLSGVVFGLLGGFICITIFYLLMNFAQSLHINFNFAKYFYFALIMIIILGLIFGLSGSFISSRSVTLKIDKLK